MAQHDYNLANQSGADFRADLNDALAAIVTVNSGATSPSTTFAHQLWVDTANSVLKIRNSANDAWITTGVSITADNTFTGNITGNASTATALETARTINGVSFDGTANISFDTDSVSEGYSNLYFTNARVESYLDAGTSTPTFASAVINSSLTGSAVLDDDTFATASATTVATSESIKAYVDSQVGSVDTLAEILLNGNTTGGTDIEFGDNDKAIFGTGSDLEIYHDGSDSYIDEVGTGNLLINANNLRLRDNTGNPYLLANAGDELRLYFNGSTKLKTTSTGIDVTGNITASGNIDINSDSGVLQFGADNDMQIFHNGTNGEINISTGSLTIDSPNTITLNADQSGRVLLSDGATNYGRFQKGGSSWNFHGLVQNNSFRFLGNDGGTETEVMRIQYDGNIGIGTSSPDALLEIDKGSEGEYLRVGGDNASNARSLRFTSSTASGSSVGALHTIKANSVGGEIAFANGNGNIMYLNVDRNVGIGTTSPSNPLDVAGIIRSTSTNPQLRIHTSSGTGTGFLVFGDSADDDIGQINYAHGDNSMRFVVNASERARFDSSGNFGIGTSSPSAKLHLNTSDATATYRIQGATSAAIDFYNSTTKNGALLVNSSNFLIAADNSNPILFNTGGSETARFDTSGNFLVGQTSQSPNTVGISLNNNGNISAKRDGGIVALFNRATSDGEIISIRKDDATVGSIGTSGGDLIAGTGDTGLYFYDGADTVIPWNISTNSARNGSIDLGASSHRFKDLYLSGGLRGDTTFKNNAGTTEYARFDSSGNLLVGTTTLNDVNGIVNGHLFEAENTTAGEGAVGVYNNAGTANCPALLVLNRDTSTDSTNRFVQFYADVTSSGATAMGGIVGNGASNVQFATLSDEREKENITPVDNVLNKLMNLNVVSFDWKKNDEHVKAGFIAQNVEEHFPEYVIENIANNGEESRKGTTGGMSAGYIAVLTKAIQEQQEQIESLKSEIAKLKGE